MTGKIFEMLKKDNTRYIVNAEKLNDLERLTTTTQLILTKITTSKALNSCYICFDVLDRHHRKLLDMQCLLVTVQTVKFTLKKEAVTVNEIFDYCEKHYTSALKETKKLIITAITNGYLKEYKNLNLEEV